MPETWTHASLDLVVRSKSLLSRRERFRQAMPCSATHRIRTGTKPFGASAGFMAACTS